MHSAFLRAGKTATVMVATARIALRNLPPQTSRSNWRNLQARKVQTQVKLTLTYTTMKDVQTIQTSKQPQKTKPTNIGNSNGRAKHITSVISSPTT